MQTYIGICWLDFAMITVAHREVYPSLNRCSQNEF